MQDLTKPFKGFSRVLISAQGEALTPQECVAYGIDAAIMGFMRDDGWTIGAPSHLERDCFWLWPKQWTHFIRMPSMEWQPISEYKPDL